MANKIQLNLDEKPYSVIKKLKPRTIKLFVSIAIERFAQTDESKLFFKDSEIVENKIIKIEGITLLVTNFQESIMNIGINAMDKPK